MNDADRRMVIEKVVEKVFMPDVLIVLKGFMQEAVGQALFVNGYKDATGFDIAQPPVVLDLRHAQDHLVDSLAVVLKEEVTKTQ